MAGHRTQRRAEADAAQAHPLRDQAARRDAAARPDLPGPEQAQGDGGGEGDFGHAEHEHGDDLGGREEVVGGRG